MIDPDSIIVTDTKLKEEIKLGEIPEFDFETYPDLDEDEKVYKHYISDIEKEVRSSFEYKQFINFLRNYMDMNQCSFLFGVSNKENTNIKIEIHHYPFTLYDICEIVYTKRLFYNESLDVEMVAKEVMQLHYKLMVGLIPLSRTVHKLVHNGKLFIPITSVLGRYDLFIELYDSFITPEQKDIINRIEKYTYEEKSELLNTTILDANNLSLDVKSEEYQLPPINNIGNVMLEQIQAIKDNSYRLPTIHDEILIEDKNERKPIEPAIYTLSDLELTQYNSKPESPIYTLSEEEIKLYQ